MLTLLDRYIFKRLIDFFVLGLVVFTLVLFFSDTLLDFMRDLQHYGIPLDIALTLIGLHLPKVVTHIIPVSALLAVLMVYNTLNNQFELIAMRMSGIGLYRLAIPAIVVGIFATLLTYVLHDYVVPMCNKYSRALKTYAVNQQNLPATEENFMYKQFDQAQRQQLKRLIYISRFEKDQFGYSTLIDLTNPDTLQVIQARKGRWKSHAIELKDANVYTVAANQKVTNTTHADHLVLEDFIHPMREVRENPLKEMSFWVQKRWMDERVKKGKRTFEPKDYVNLWEKLTIPLTSLPLVLIAVPLAMTSPRKLNNLGFLMAIVILFIYYLIRHISVQLGIFSIVPPLLAAALPLILILVIASILFHRKNLVL